jgi:hypothetical protein
MPPSDRHQDQRPGNPGHHQQEEEGEGQSISAVTVAEAMKSRTDSNERRLAAKEPTEAGRSAMRMPSTRSMIRAESLWSMRAPGQVDEMAAQQAQRVVHAEHQQDAGASIHSVSTAKLGTTRSYTFMVNSGIASAKMLMHGGGRDVAIHRQLLEEGAPEPVALHDLSPTSGVRWSKRKCGRAKMTMPA